MALAEKTKRKKILENDKRSYAAWLSDYGIDPERIAGGKIASVMKEGALSSVNYGAKAESLLDKGLSDDGYAAYLKALSNDKARLKIQNAGEELIQNRYKNSRGYQEYVEKYKTLQGKIMESVKKTLIDMECFDTNEAYEIALNEGLSDENAKSIATIGTRLAKEKVTNNAIAHVTYNNFSLRLARMYAQTLGLDEDYIKRIERAVKSHFNYVTDSIYENMTPEEYEDYLKNSKNNYVKG